MVRAIWSVQGEITASWKRKVADWDMIKGQIAIAFGPENDET